VSFAAVNAHIMMKLLPDEKQMKAHLALHDLVCDDRREGTADRKFRRMFGRANVNELNKVDESEVFLLNYTKYAEDGARDIEIKIGSSQVVVLPDVISDMLNFIKVAPTGQLKPESSSLSAQPKNIASESTHVVVTDDVPNQVEACFESIGSAGLPALKKTNYQIESSNMRLVLVDLGSIDSPSPFVSSKSISALSETIVLQGKMQAKFEMTSDTVTDTTVEKDYKIDAERVEIYTAQGVDSLHPVQILEPAKFVILYYQKVCNRRAEHSTDLKFVTLSPIDLTISMQNAALASTLASSISDSFAIEEENIVGDNEFHPLSTTDANRIARLNSALMRDVDDQAEDSSERISRHSSHSGDLRPMRRSTRLKMTSPEATLTVINDFQGLVSFTQRLQKDIITCHPFNALIRYTSRTKHCLRSVPSMLSWVERYPTLA
jgi:vacuolar protein sorting-associated protein 13A/C